MAIAKKNLNPIAEKYQTVDWVQPSRAEHIWFRYLDKSQEPVTKFKCCLCGAVTDKPPFIPTPAEWLPERYDKLTDHDRDLCPYTKE